MFTEDYLMRIINQVLAVLMTAIGLRKAGKYSEARQALEQAIEQLTALPASIVDLMEDEALLSTLNTNGQLDVGRLALLADLYQEQGEIFSGMGKQDQAFVEFARALRFDLEVALFDDANLSTENIGKIEGLLHRLKDRTLPFDTELALSDYYQRLLERDDPSLAAAGLSRHQVSRILADLQEKINSSPTSIGD
jgi:tetratricopeptide (TPR) repeat protein